MESTSIMALLMVGNGNTARSALPNSPQMAEVPGRRRLSGNALRGRLATCLHRLAWTIETDAPPHPEVRPTLIQDQRSNP
jgi:hypothetical protein